MEGIKYDQNDSNLRNLARCDCPPQGWYKINFDGASKGNPRIAGCGLIIRNENGDCLGIIAIPIRDQTNHVVESSVAIYGL